MVAADAVGVAATARTAMAAHRPFMYDAIVGELVDVGEEPICHTPIIPQYHMPQATVDVANGNAYFPESRMDHTELIKVRV